MELIVRGQFIRDLKTYADKQLFTEVGDKAKEIEAAKTISQIQQLKKFRRYRTLYRIKIAENYRIGLIIRGNTVWFTRFGHRNTIYKYFP